MTAGTIGLWLLTGCREFSIVAWAGGSRDSHFHRRYPKILWAGSGIPDMSFSFLDMRTRQRTHARTIELLAFWGEMSMSLKGEKCRSPTNRDDNHSLTFHTVSAHIQLCKNTAARTGIGLWGVITQ